MPGLWAAADGPGLAAGHDGSVRAVPDDIATHQRPPPRPYFGARRDCVRALAVTAFVLLVVTCTTSLMSVETAGIKRTASLFSGPQELVRQNMGELGAVVVFVTVLAPLLRLVRTLYVLIRLHERMPPRHLRRIFALAERLRPWSMIEVFVFGVFVAYVKLGDLVTIGLMAGVYALLVLTFVLVWLDSALDREAVWERLHRGSLAGVCHPWAGMLGCETCGMVSVPGPEDPRCPRCESALHERKPDSVARTWGLVAATTILYIPPGSRARSSAASRSW